MFKTVKTLDKIPLTCGLISCVLGLVVIIGWYTHNELLIQINPHFAPMQYNTALGFLLSGTGLIALYTNHKHFATIMGLATSILGGLTLSQYIFEIDFGIDQMFMEHYITTKTSHIGRMAPNTALCFFLTGLTLLICGLTGHRKNNNIFAEFLSMTILGLAFMAFWGYVQMAERAYGWSDLTRMALHTTLGFVVLGTGLIKNTWAKEKREISRVPLWVPFALFIGALTLDIYTPLGVSAGTAYVLLIFCSLWFNNASAAFILAAVSTVLVVVGYFASHGIEAPEHLILSNRLISVGAIWVVAIVVYMQKSTAIKLQESQKQFRNAIEFSAIGTALVAPNGQWLHANQALCDILGYSPEELLKIDFQTITHPDDLNQDLEYVQKVLDNEIQTYSMEKRYFHKNGHIIWALLSVSLARAQEGEPLYFISQIQDITERKESEKKLLNANNELEEFAYRTSHDLRAPLVSSIRLLKLAQEEVSNKNYDIAQKSMGLSEESLIKLETLVKDILQLTKTKNTTEETTDINLEDLLDKALQKLSHMENFERLDIQKELNFKNTFESQKGRIVLILENLISNAVKYQDLEKENSYVKISTYSKYNKVVIEVEDNGLGIPKNYQKDLFSMFKRFHPKTSFGSGLGLYMIRKSADVLGGELVYEDTGSGSKFKLYIPTTHEEIK